MERWKLCSLLISHLVIWAEAVAGGCEGRGHGPLPHVLKRTSQLVAVDYESDICLDPSPEHLHLPHPNPYQNILGRPGMLFRGCLVHRPGNPEPSLSGHFSPPLGRSYDAPPPLALTA